MGIHAALVATLSTPLLPAWALFIACHPRLRRDVRERLGLDVVPISPGSVWVHAASVGEITAAEALLPHLPRPILLTADTDTGAERARAISRNHEGVVAGVRPVDHPWLIAPLWAEARPRGLVFVEGTYWTALAARAWREGVPVFRVSAKAGLRTRRWPWLQRFFPAVRVVARDAGEAQFFRETASCPVDEGGDLKGDRALPENPLRWRRTFVAGASTRAGDEEALVEAWLVLRREGAHKPGLLLAPRHLDRVPDVVRALEGREVPFRLRSELADGTIPASIDVVVLDTMGELFGCLCGARVVFVGGTFDPALGGHSPREALLAGATIVAGPHRHANATAFDGVDVIEARDHSALGEALVRAFSRQAPTVLRNDAGKRTAEQILPWLSTGAAPEACPRPWALPVGVVLAAATSVRKRLGEVLSVSVSVPVIAIGSANARGPGKTSTARWFARALRDRGHRVGVITRGYRRSRAGSDVRLSTRSNDAADLGDEGALFAMDGFTVAAGPDRVRAANALVDEGVTAIVLDDGLQDVRLVRDLEICVVDARFPGARGLLPAGERREWASVPDRVDGVVIHHADDLGAIPLPETWIRARRSLGPWHRGDAESGPPDGPIALFAGVARPADVLQSVGARVDRFRVLSDHAPIDGDFADDLVRWAGGLPVVTTAKDRIRLPEPLRSEVWWRDIVVELEGAPEVWFSSTVSDELDPGSARCDHHRATRARVSSFR